jgi:hypothetical protein
MLESTPRIITWKKLVAATENMSRAEQWGSLMCGHVRIIHDHERRKGLLGGRLLMKLGTFLADTTTLVRFEKTVEEWSFLV